MSLRNRSSGSCLKLPRPLVVVADSLRIHARLRELGLLSLLRLFWEAGRVCGLPEMASRGGKGAGANIAQRLRDIEAHLDSLDCAIRELHPEFSRRIVARLEDLEVTCRGHANAVFQVLTNQRAAVEAVVSKASTAADEACARLAAAADRHQQQGAELRREMVPLKELIEERSAQCAADLSKMASLVTQAMEHLERQEILNEQAEAQIQALTRLESLSSEVRASLRDLRAAHRDFKADQVKVMVRSRVRGESLPAVIRQAQRVAESRSPSAERVGAALREESRGRRKRD